jgi:Tfp pilus assembly protein PilO
MKRKLPKDKRDKLILVIMITVAGVLGLWFGLIKFQQNNLEDLAARKEKAEADLARVDKTIKNAENIDAELATTSKQLAIFEENMAPGDVYLWMVQNIRRFKLPYKVEIPQFSQPEIKEMTLLPKFPYKQATLTVGGTAFYHDLGKFLADLENEFPHFRVLNLDIEPMPAAMGAEKEKLSFKMDIVTLIKPGVS